LNEKALPLDVSKVARLIRMPKSLPAIQGVLDEFFVKSDDGWHNKRADEELTSMLAKQEQQAKTAAKIEKATKAPPKVAGNRESGGEAAFDINSASMDEFMALPQAMRDRLLGNTI